MTFPQNIEILDVDILWTQKVSSRDHATQHNNVNRIVNVLQNLMLGLTPPSGSNIYNVACVFDDGGSDLPTIVPGIIDNYSIQNDDLVYVKDCSDVGKINKIYKVVISGGSISYIYVATLWTWDILNVENGDIYGWHTYVYNPITNTIILNNYGTKLRSFTTTGTSTAYKITVASYTAYADDDIFIIYPHVSSGGSASLNVNELWAVPISLGWNVLTLWNFYIVGYKSGAFKILAGIWWSTGWVMVQEAGVDVAQATTVNFQSWATVTDMWGGTVRVDITWGGGWIGLVNIDSANDSLVFAGDPTWTLTGDLPLSADLVHLTTDSWTNLILGIDYTIDITTGILTWILTPSVWETVYARWVTGNRTPGTVPGGLAYYEEFIATPAQTTFILNDTPAGANWIRVSTESSLYGKRTLIASRDRHYDIWTNSIVFEYTLAENDVVSVQYIGFVAQPVIYPVTPVEPITDIVNAQAGDYILVTYILGWTTINLPDATTCNGKTVKVKKFTGEDVLVTTILPFGAQLIDGFTGATMNINRTMYTFTAINGNWYLWD